MTPPASRLSLLALAIAAALPAGAAAADYSCPSSSGQSVACNLNGTYGDVTVATGAVLNATSFGLRSDHANISTLTNNGSISGRNFGIYSYSSTITTLNNSGTIYGDDSGLFSSYSTITTLNNSGSISGDLFGLNLKNLSGPMTINHSGLIRGAVYAIDAGFAGNDVTLNWNGGTIEGGFGGVKTLNLNLDHANLITHEMPNASTVRMRLSADNSQPVLTINHGNGTFSFGAGSQILLRPSASNFAVNNQSYTLIQGQGGSAPGLNVHSESPYLTVNGFSVGTSITANVSIAAEAPQITQAGGSSNAQRAGSAITPLLSAMANRAPNDPLLDALAGSQALQVSEQLVPQVNGGSLQAAYNLNDAAQGNASQRTQDLRGAAAGDAFAERGLWLKALDSDVTQDTRDGIEGYNADLSGLAIGADGKLNDQLTLGLSYSHLNSDVRDDGGNQSDIDGHAITLYSGYEQDAWFLDSGLTLGLNHNDSSRYIAGTEAKADYDSQLLGLDVLGGYGMQLDHGVLVEPRAAARYARVDIDSFREQGSLAALSVDSQRYEVGELGAGLRVAGSLPLGQGTLEPQAKVMAYHDFAADQINTSASFTFGGSPFLASGASPSRTRYEAGLGVEYKLAASTFGVSYDYSGKEDFQANTWQAKARYDF